MPVNPNLKPFKPGESGNPGGKTKKPLVDKLLQEALAANDSEDAKKIAGKLISMAKNGSLNAIKLIAERTEGKPKRNADDSQKESGIQLTKEQINARLIELLASPELKETVSKALFNSGEKQVQ
jgi:HPt (histidine-containing phosphotransfer) domain-containing protein